MADTFEEKYIKLDNLDNLESRGLIFAYPVKLLTQN